MKRILILIAILFTLQITYACDICGCSSGNYFIGPYPHFQNKLMGFRYTYRKFYSKVADEPEFSHDLYQTMEVWGGTTLGSRWQIMAFIPYNINHQLSDDEAHNKQGFGDITLLASYQLFPFSGNVNKHQIWLAGGLKLPTGHFNPELGHDAIPSANMQPGTGSLDFIFNANDVFFFDKWSLYSNAAYKLNGTAKDFRFGNRFSISSNLARSLPANKVTFSPYLGLQYEHLDHNSYANEQLAETGGHALLATAGMDVQLGKFNLGVNFQLPTTQNFSGKQTEIKSRGMVQLNFLF